MIELHGWVTIRDTYEAIFEEGDNIDFVVAEIGEKINQLHWFKPKIKNGNGSPFIQFSNFANRIRPDTEEIFQLFEYIGKVAKGSYGLIYLYDDENTNGQQNHFQVFSLARGVVKKHVDPFLSPIIPTIEDEDIDVLY